MILEVLYEFGIGVIEFVPGKVNFCGAMAIDAPAHAEVCELAHLIHFLDGSMTGLTLHLPYPYVLRMIEVSQIREVMDLYPLDGMSGAGVSVAIRIEACIAI